VLLSDRVEGRSEAELRRNGTTVLDWSVVKGRIIAPAPVAGVDLDNMRVGEAKHVGVIHDFSRGNARPLAHRSASRASRDSDLFPVTRDHASRSFAGRRTP
jgi:hypothetical protein